MCADTGAHAYTDTHHVCAFITHMPHIHITQTPRNTYMHIPTRLQPHAGTHTVLLPPLLVFFLPSGGPSARVCLQPGTCSHPALSACCSCLSRLPSAAPPGPRPSVLCASVQAGSHLSPGLGVIPLGSWDFPLCVKRRAAGSCSRWRCVLILRAACAASVSVMALYPAPAWYSAWQLTFAVSCCLGVSCLGDMAGTTLCGHNGSGEGPALTDCGSASQQFQSP